MKNSFVSKLDNKTTYTLYPLTAENLHEARKLCDLCVGENMYSEEELAAVLYSEDRFFFLAALDTGEMVGYIYFYLDEMENLTGDSPLPTELLHSAGIREKQSIGKLQSIGVLQGHRGTGVAVFMMQFALDMLRLRGIDTVFGICWKVGEKIPMKNIMDELSFRYLCDIEKFWYNNSELKCPHCGGRCSCDAAVYYKFLD